jgi:hypothetical protein
MLQQQLLRAQQHMKAQSDKHLSLRAGVPGWQSGLSQSATVCANIPGSSKLPDTVIPFLWTLQNLVESLHCCVQAGSPSSGSHP